MEPKNELELIGAFIDTAVSNGGYANRREVAVVSNALEKTGNYIKVLESKLKELEEEKSTPKPVKK